MNCAQCIAPAEPGL